MKKIIALLVMILFVVSTMPLVFAEDSETNTGNTKTWKERLEQIREKRVQIREINTENREIRAQAREQRGELKGENKQLRVELREELKACKNDSSQCQELRTQMRANVKEGLIISADEMIALMENLKEKIQVLNVSNKDELIAAVDADIAKVQEIKSKLEALPDDANASEVKALAKELRDIWKEIRKQVRIRAVRMLAIGFERVLAKAERLETRLDNVIAKLQEKGYNTTTASAKVEEFKTHIQAARDNYNEAKAKLEELQDNPGLEDAVQAIQEKMKASPNTIAKVDRWLNFGRNGYLTAIRSRFDNK